MLRRVIECTKPLLLRLPARRNLGIEGYPIPPMYPDSPYYDPDATRLPKDFLIPKLEHKLEYYAKKMRQAYLDMGVPDTHKRFVEAIRLRGKGEGWEELINNKELPGCIEGREEFSDLDLVFRRRVAFTLGKSDCNLHYTLY